MHATRTSIYANRNIGGYTVLKSQPIVPTCPFSVLPKKWRQIVKWHVASMSQGSRCCDWRAPLLTNQLHFFLDCAKKNAGWGSAYSYLTLKTPDWPQMKPWRWWRGKMIVPCWVVDDITCKWKSELKIINTSLKQMNPALPCYSLRGTVRK